MNERATVRPPLHSSPHWRLVPLAYSIVSEGCELRTLGRIREIQKNFCLLCAFQFGSVLSGSSRVFGDRVPKLSLGIRIPVSTIKLKEHGSIRNRHIGFDNQGAKSPAALVEF